MALDWTQLHKHYKGLWVALAADESTVVGSGKTANEALMQAKNKTGETPILTRIPTKIVSYVGTI